MKTMGLKAVVMGAVTMLSVACGQLTTQDQEAEKKDVVEKTDGGSNSKPSQCPAAPGVVATYEPSQILAKLDGRWVYCSGDAALGSGDGIEFDAAGGQFYILEKDGSGAYVRKAGFMAGGALKLDDPSRTQVDLLWSEGGGTFGFPEFTTGPEVMRFNYQTQNPPLYARLP